MAEIAILTGLLSLAAAAWMRGGPKERRGRRSGTGVADQRPELPRSPQGRVTVRLVSPRPRP